MESKSNDQSEDKFFSRIGPDATAMFDNLESNPAEHASGEATIAATAVDGEDERLEEADDDAAELEEDDEENEEVNIEDKAGL
jgi:hypothetical protein